MIRPLAVLVAVFAVVVTAVVQAAEPVPSWIVEETSGTVRLMQPGKIPRTLRGADPVSVFQGDRLAVGRDSHARVFDGRESLLLLPQDTGAARTHTAPAPPPDSSVFARLLADAGTRKDHRAAAGVVVRIPGDLKCQFVVPGTGRYFAGAPPRPVVLVTGPLNVPHELVVTTGGVDVARLVIPSEPGEHRLSWAEEGQTPPDWVPGATYLLAIEAGGSVLAEREIQCATDEQSAALEQDRRQLLGELADAGVKDTAPALQYLEAAHQFISPRE